MIKHSRITIMPSRGATLAETAADAISVAKVLVKNVTLIYDNVSIIVSRYDSVEDIERRWKTEEREQKAEQI